MRIFKDITERDSRVATTALVILLLVAGLGSLIAGSELMPDTREIVSNGEQESLAGPEAAAKGWPSSTPRQKPLSTPSQISIGKRFGVWQYHAYGAQPENENDNEFFMRVEQAGWPWPVLERKDMAWEWSDPTMSGVESSPAPSVLYGGLLMNSIVLGGGAWLVFAVLGLCAITRRCKREKTPERATAANRTEEGVAS
jgi:hypothetical protein